LYLSIGEKINGSDYAFDLGLGAVTGAISGAILRTSISVFASSPDLEWVLILVSVLVLVISC
jgi:hypothetical protein